MKTQIVWFDDKGVVLALSPTDERFECHIMDLLIEGALCCIIHVDGNPIVKINFDVLAFLDRKDIQ